MGVGAAISFETVWIAMTLFVSLSEDGTKEEATDVMRCYW